MEGASSAAARGGLAAALADNLDPSGEASPGKAVLDAVDADVLVASGDGVLPEHAVTAVVGDDELAILVSLGSEPDTHAVTPPVDGELALGTAEGTAEGTATRDDDAASDGVDGATGTGVVTTVSLSLAGTEVSGDAGLLVVGVVDAERGVEAVVTTLSSPTLDEHVEPEAVVEAVGEATETAGAAAAGWTDEVGGWLGKGYCRPGVFGIEIDTGSLLGACAPGTLLQVAEAVCTVGLIGFGLELIVAEETHSGDLAAGMVAERVGVDDDKADGDESGEGNKLALPEGEMGPLFSESPKPGSPAILKALVTGTNSLGSYLSLTFSSRFESSSKTDRLARTRLTISDGLMPGRSKSRHLCFERNRSVTELSTLDRVSPPDAQMALDPVHCSYILSSALTRSSREWSVVGECLGELKFPPSESDDEGDGAEGGRRDGGGDAGGGTGLGLGLGTGRETGLGEVTAGGDEIDDSLAAADCLGGNCIWAANLKRREGRLQSDLKRLYYTQY